MRNTITHIFKWPILLCFGKLCCDHNAQSADPVTSQFVKLCWSASLLWTTYFVPGSFLGNGGFLAPFIGLRWWCTGPRGGAGRSIIEIRAWLHSCAVILEFIFPHFHHLQDIGWLVCVMLLTLHRGHIVLLMPTCDYKIKMLHSWLYTEVTRHF